MTCYECFSDWLTADDKTCTVVETVVGDFFIKKTCGRRWLNVIINTNIGYLFIGTCYVQWNRCIGNLTTESISILFNEAITCLSRGKSLVQAELRPSHANRTQRQGCCSVLSRYRRIAQQVTLSSHMYVVDLLGNPSEP